MGIVPDIALLLRSLEHQYQLKKRCNESEQKKPYSLCKGDSPISVAIVPDIALLSRWLGLVNNFCPVGRDDGRREKRVRRMRTEGRRHD
jgi:hypothetical protein